MRAAMRKKCFLKKQSHQTSREPLYLKLQGKKNRNQKYFEMQNFQSQSKKDTFADGDVGQVVPYLL